MVFWLETDKEENYKPKIFVKGRPAWQVSAYQHQRITSEETDHPVTEKCMVYQDNLLIILTANFQSVIPFSTSQ